MNPKIMEMINTQAFPTPFCPGCGHGILMNALLRAVAEMEYDLQKNALCFGALAARPGFRVRTLKPIPCIPCTAEPSPTLQALNFTIPACRWS